MKKEIWGLLVLLLVLPFSFSAGNDLPTNDCSGVENQCNIDISKLNQNISDLNESNFNLSNNSEYYQNLSKYYMGLYENASAGITNKNLDKIYLIQNNLNQTYIELTQNYGKVINWNIGLSIGFLGITIFEIVNRIKLFRKKKKKKDGEK